MVEDLILFSPEENVTYGSTRNDANNATPLYHLTLWYPWGQDQHHVQLKAQLKKTKYNLNDEWTIFLALRPATLPVPFVLY